jgi:hypothetical protein
MKANRVSTSQNTFPSIVGTVASHEQELIAQLEASKVEAGELLEQSRVEARKVLQDSEAALTEEIAQVRREREASREQSFQSTVAEAEGRLVSVREEAAKQVDAMSQEVLSLFMPKSTGGN